MKYILRIIVVILLIGGITFGVIQCNNKKSNEQAYMDYSQQCVNLANDSLSCVNSVKSYDYTGSLEQLRAMIETNNTSITKFVGELNFAKNISGKDLADLSSKVKDMNNYVNQQKTDSRDILDRVEARVDQDIQMRYVREFVKTYKAFTKSYLNASLNISNSIKKYVYNDSENYTELNNLINSINSNLQNPILKEA